MPRPLRVWFPEALYHVVVRGNNREPIFFSGGDYRKYLQVVQEGKARFACRLFAYALMTNHIHLMIQTGSRPIAKLMQFINTTYTMYVNGRYGRVGHLFQGRYHSTLVEKESYAVELTRYIHLNPVRAGMARLPEEYPWSSYPAYVKGEQGALVEATEMLIMASPGQMTDSERQHHYAQFVMDGLVPDESRDSLFMRKNILGSPAFIARVTEGSDPRV